MKKHHFTVSYEIRSPERGSSLETYITQLKSIIAFKPLFLSIANHQPLAKYKVDADSNLRKIVPDRYPSTYAFAMALKERFHVEVIPHLLCNELDPETIDDILLGFHYLGINKIMALRGDRDSNDTRFSNRYTYATDLIKHILAFTEKYKLNFDMGVAGYPEQHPYALSMEDDIRVLADKVALGASFITTQMFLDNDRFYHFQSHCKKALIDKPIYPGLKLILKPSNLDQYSKRFQLNIPKEMQSDFRNATADNFKAVGEAWLFKQCQDLINHGEHHLHFYVFSNEDIQGVANVLTKLKGQ